MTIPHKKTEKVARDGKKVGKRMNNHGKKYKPNDLHRGMVIAYATAGYSFEDIAKKIGIHYQTMLKYYRWDIEQAHKDTEYQAIANILQRIKNGDVGCAKWFLARRTKQWGKKSR